MFARLASSLARLTATIGRSTSRKRTRLSLRAVLAGALLALPTTAMGQTSQAPNLLSPRTGWCSLTATPTLRWHGAGGQEHVSLCRDRACSAVFAEADVEGGAWTPTTPLTRGVWFWRVRRGAQVSPVWSFTVTARPGGANVIVPRCTDVDGDGYGDALLRGMTFAHRVSLHWGSRAGFVRRGARLLTEPPAARSAPMWGDVDLAGDLDGDGYADLLWRHPFVPSRARMARDPLSATSRDAGAVLVFRGGPRGLSTAPSVRLYAREGEFLFGDAATPAGDVDGDGRGDLLVTSSPGGSDRAPGGLQLRRRLFERGGAITEDITGLPCRSGEAAFAAAGDVDGDGFADVLGACGSTSSARPNPALVRVYHGSPDGLVRPEDLDLTAERSIVGADVRVASLGDVDGDGYGDVVAAWHGASVTPAVVMLWRGSPRGMRGPEALERPTSDASQTADLFGWIAGTVGDLDGDGRDDVMLSVSDTTQAFYRGGPRFDAPLLFTRGDGLPVSYFGVHRVCGDVDGDGHADVVLGANCVETDADTGDSCLRREHYLLRGGADGVSPSRMQPVPE